MALPAINSRRSFLKTLAAGAAAFSREDPWAQAPVILGRIRPPEFPRRDFEVTRYGAASDGVTDATDAFRRAIEACARAGGGRVVVPAGNFLTAAIHLKSGVNLHISAGATVRFSQDPRKYLPAVFSRWEGVECLNYSPFIYAYEQENIAVTGTGILDGQADCAHWWPWKGRTECGWKKGDPSQDKARQRLMDLAEQDLPVNQRVFGDGDYLRPQFIQTYKCRNVLIEGVTIKNSPMWEIHPVLSTNVTVRRVTVISHGPNNDGCDPESCTDVLIKDCIFDTGDDCIALKSGRNRDGRRVGVPCQNVVIQGCVMRDGHGGVTIGSETSGGVRNVFAEDCRMDSPNLDRALRIKTNSVRGGIIEHIYMRNVQVGQVADAAIHADLFYEEGDAGAFKPVVRNIEVRNLTCRKSRYALYLRGYKDAPIRDVRLAQCTFDNVARPNRIENVEGLALTDVEVRRSE
jgi:polygalacturonase